MIYAFYACLLIGLLLLIADITGRLTASPERARSLRYLGIISAAGPGLAPALAWLTGRLGVNWPFPPLAVAYLVAFMGFAIGGFAFAGLRSVWLQRVGYLGLLLLASLPSMVLLLLSPLVALAGVGLTRSRTPFEEDGPSERPRTTTN